MEAKLSPKQARFVQEYLIDLNATQAAIRAGYSETSAKVTASRLLTKANVREAVDAGTAKAAEKAGLNVDVVLAEIGKIATAYTEEPIKQSDKLKALEMAGKHFGMFKDRLEHSGPNGGPIEVKDEQALARWIALKLTGATQ